MAALSFVILPVLPDQDYGPYNALNPHQIWLMVVLISGISLAGYIALRITGGHHGVLLLGLFGGLVSSTATSMVYARHARDPGMLQLAAVVILTASLRRRWQARWSAALRAPSIGGAGCASSLHW